MGEVREVLVGTRTHQDTMATDIYNASFDFGSFPGWIWNSHGNAYESTFGCADLNGGTFLNNDFSWSDFSYANLTNCTFGDGTTGAWTSFSYTSLSGADCTGSTFYGVGGPNPNVGAADWVHVDCTGTIFRNCRFINIQFQGLGLIGADFTGATFQGCSWTTWNGSTEGTVYWDDTTIFPAGFNVNVFPASAHAYLNYGGQTLTNVSFADQFGGHANFNGAVLTNVYLPYCLTWANFENATLVSNTMQGSHSYPNFSWANLHAATIDVGTDAQNRSPMVGVGTAAHADFSNTTWTFSGGQPGQQWAQWGYCGFESSNLAYANFDYMTAPPDRLFVFWECNCAHASFVGATLGPTTHYAPDPSHSRGIRPDYEFMDTNFAYADFTGASGGWWTMCDFSNAKFTGANMPYSDFNESYLGYADLTDAKVTPSALYGTMTEQGGYAGQGNWNAALSDTSGVLATPQYGSLGNYFGNAGWCVLGFFYSALDPAPGTVSVVGQTRAGPSLALQQIATFTNAQSGGKGYLSVWFNSFPNPSVVVPAPLPGVLINSAVNWFYTFPPGTYIAAGWMAFTMNQSVRDLQFQVIDFPANDGSWNGAGRFNGTTVPARSDRNGMTNVAAFFGRPAIRTMAPAVGGTLYNTGVQVVTDQGPANAGGPYFGQNGYTASFGGRQGFLPLGAFMFAAYAPLTAAGTWPMECYSLGDYRSNAGGVPSAIGVSMALDKGGSIPAFYNSATKLPSNISKSSMRAALTGLTDKQAQFTDGHQDFSHQTISSTAGNGPYGYSPDWVNAFGADFNHSHFLGQTYGNISAYNSNFEGCTFDPSFVYPQPQTGPNWQSDAYQSHFGGPPLGVGVPRGGSDGAAGPRRVWRVP